MKLILLSGGSGKRLWPLSNDSRSKQFLKVLRSPQGELESMVQRVWRQLDAVGLGPHSYIATGRAQVEMIQSQLGAEARLITEPERRDTFPAIALAASYLYSMTDTGLQETVAVLPVDPYVEDRFFLQVAGLEKVLNDSGADLALIGVTPTYPSEKYGYLVPQGEVSASAAPEETYRKVARFTEKPDEAGARELIRERALWNCGVFAFKLDYLINELIARGLPIQYEELLKQYGQLKKISFDYEVVEQAKHIVCTAYDGDWKDLGTWNTLTEEMSTTQLGKGILTEECQGSYLLNELDIPVTVMGLTNVIVAASPDGILVTEKEASPRIKEVLKHTEARPMYEERRWGWYRVLDCKKYGEGQEMLTKRIGIRAGCNLSYQLHEKRREVWTILSGSGELILDGRLYPVDAGDVWQIPVGVKHSLRAFTELELIEVQTGSELVEEDIVRLCFDWDEALRLIQKA
ncbi:sugar phosphate nucleotidyltransferase [Paenibacillus aurantius]|uniref:Sugar phosphate nucleotidyltransferase n=1 Tax=Paenibacillus aurantius TaxID=2918900 RepID=A0AA96LBU7_9BACL|nr:sugar phosphate nucleotidyltransferase [Paenibacillus aurantius]WNQ10822.1 sugar phosphate nucleotidyltransferase [Paenibacillus aurantius]